MTRFRLPALAASVALVAACAGDPPPPDSASTPSTPAPPTTTTEAAPGEFRVRLETSKGTVVLQLNRAWAPLGVDRFYQLVQTGFFNDARFFRVLPGFVVQFGINGDPAVTQSWEGKDLMDEPVTQTNRRGVLTYAKTMAPNTRSTQLFINLADNPNLDGMGFSPIGEVVEGMDVIDQLFSGYGESPDQSLINLEGNAYLTRQFPNLDFIRSATIVR